MGEEVKGKGLDFITSFYQLLAVVKEKTNHPKRMHKRKATILNDWGFYDWKKIELLKDHFPYNFDGKFFII